MSADVVSEEMKMENTTVFVGNLDSSVSEEQVCFFVRLFLGERTNQC